MRSIFNLILVIIIIVVVIRFVEGDKPKSDTSIIQKIGQELRAAQEEFKKGYNEPDTIKKDTLKIIK